MNTSNPNQSAAIVGQASSLPTNLNRLQREHLVFEVDGLLYAAALADFDSVAEAKFEPQTVPGLPCWAGLLDDNGRATPVLSLHHTLDESLVTDSAIEENSHRLMIFRVGDTTCALHVHRCHGVFPLETAIHFPLTHSPLLSEDYAGLRNVIQWRSQLVIALDPAQLIPEKLIAKIRQHLAETNSKKRNRKKQTDTSAQDALNTLELNGNVSGDALAHVLQVIWLQQLSGELTLKDELQSASIFLDKGRVIHAKTDTAPSPEFALNDALKSRSGSYTFRSAPTKNIPHTLRIQTDQLVRSALVGRVTPCAPGLVADNDGAHGVTRPTTK